MRYASQCPPFRNRNLRGKRDRIAGLPRSARGSNLASMFNLEGIDHVALAVRDVARSAAWYIDVLGFEHRHQAMWDGVPVFVGLGQTALALFPARNAGEAAPARGAIAILHLAFRANRREFLAAQHDFKSRGIPFEFHDHEISHSIYFDDPDGHHLEITTYEVAEAAGAPPASTD